MSTTIVNDLPVKLTPAEKALKSDQLVADLHEIRDLEEQKKTSASEFDSKIKRKKEHAQMLAHDLRSGTELRPVECFERPVYGEMIVEVIRIDTGEVVSTRGMHPSERQHALEFEADVATAGKRRRKRSDEAASESGEH